MKHDGRGSQALPSPPRPGLQGPLPGAGVGGGPRPKGGCDRAGGPGGAWGVFRMRGRPPEYCRLTRRRILCVLEPCFLLRVFWNQLVRPPLSFFAPPFSASSLLISLPRLFFFWFFFFFLFFVPVCSFVTVCTFLSASSSAFTPPSSAAFSRTLPGLEPFPCQPVYPASPRRFHQCLGHRHC